MKAKIETYRGWDIFFDTEEEIFYTHSEENDRQEKKRSYASTKKFIDDFIKENETFKPVNIVQIPSGYSPEMKVKALVGIRKDRAFVYEHKGEKRQLGQYDERNYVVYAPEKHDPIFKQLAEIAAQMDVIRTKREALIKEFENGSTTIAELKKNY